MKFWLSKFVKFYKSKGLFYALRRGVYKLGDLTYRGPYVFFCADLTQMTTKADILPAGFSIECCKAEGDISLQDREILLRNIRERDLQRDMKERFAKGTLFWLVRVGNELAGYIWTIRGTTIEPYIHPLAANDVHFFDNLIFEEFRGRGINPVLVSYVLSEMQKQHCVRAFIETRMTNISEIRSLAKTCFRKCGLAKKRHPWRCRHFVVWQEMPPAWVDFSEKKIETQVFESFESLLRIQPEWDNFVESLGCDIFLTYDWCKIWWKYYGGKKQLRIFVFRYQGELVGLLPTYIEKIGIGPVAVKVARIVGTTFVLAEVNPPVAGVYMRQVMEQWLKRLSSEFKPDIVCVGPIPGTYDRIDQLVGECAAYDNHRFIVEKNETGVLTIFRLGASLDEYLTSLSGKERHEVNRHCRNILKVAPGKDSRIIFESVSASELSSSFDEFIRMHNFQWQRLGQSGHFNEWPNSEEFHREAAESQLKRGRLRLFKVCIGQTCIGYEYAYKFSRTYFHYLNARTSAEEFERVAVGKVSFCEFVKKAVAEDINLVNSMRGRYEYKIRMGGMLVPIHAVLILRRDLFGNLRVRMFKCLSWLLNICYYKIWFSRIASKLPWHRRPLWNLWIRTNVFAYCV